MNKPSTLRRIFTTDIPVVLIILLAIGPFVWMILTSLTPTAQLSATGVSLSPAGWSMDNYVRLLKQTSFLVNMLHSLIIAAGTVILGLVVSVTAAYALSRFRFPGRKAGHAAVPAGQHVSDRASDPAALRAVSQDRHSRHAYRLILANSTVAIPFAVWMLTSYVGAIPRSLDEAAMIDGCSRLQALRRIVLPLAMPGIISTGIYIFITAWNEYLYALTLGGRNVRPVTVAIQTLIGEYQIEWGLLAAGGVVGALPATILFLLVQRRLIGGLTQGAVKG